MNSGGIYVQTSFTNLNILYNQFGNLPCCNSSIADQAIFFEGGATTSNTASTLTNTTISYNTFGDSTSCTSPMNAMTNTDSPEKYEGACNGIVFFYIYQWLNGYLQQLLPRGGRLYISIARITQASNMSASLRGERSREILLLSTTISITFTASRGRSSHSKPAVLSSSTTARMTGLCRISDRSASRWRAATTARSLNLISTARTMSLSSTPCQALRMQQAVCAMASEWRPWATGQSTATNW